MRKLTYLVATTLDGLIAGPGGGDPTGPAGFFDVPQDYIDFLVEKYPETLPTPVRAALGVTGPGLVFDTVVMGRRTFDIGADAGLPDAYAHLRTIVFSRSLGPCMEPNVEVMAADPVTAIRALKQEDGAGIWLAGGALLAETLAEEIDEIVVKVNPVVARAGTPLFSGPFAPMRLERTDVALIPSGTVVLSYQKVSDDD
ncbi:dihydrofolate reductase family protein [Streptomyces sp. NPDC014646]|uniref:dihydrofolate reductase family protein n=1 Tax=Streptomyces sp. NPDC014646 TaxID=3364877 RepID=UPI0036FF5B59